MDSKVRTKGCNTPEGRQRKHEEEAKRAQEKMERANMLEQKRIDATLKKAERDAKKEKEKEKFKKQVLALG